MEARNFLAGIGRRGEVIRSFNWSETSLGKIENWPDHLLTIVRLISNSPVPQAVLWGDDKILIYNDAFSVYTNPKQALGSRMKDEQLFFACSLRSIDKEIERGEAFTQKNIQLSSPGYTQPVAVDLNFSPITAHNGNVDGVHLMVTVNTEAVDVLEKNAVLMQLITDSLPAFISYIDKDERYQLVNKAYEEWFDTTKHHVIGKTVHEVLSGKTYDYSKPFIRRALQGEHVTFENRLERNNKLKYTHTEYVPHIAVDGSVKGFAVLGHDITQRKKAEEKLKESEEFNRSLLESSPDCVKALDTEGKLLSINPPGLKVLEIDDFAPYVGVYWPKLWKDEYYDEAHAAVLKAQSGQIGHFHGFATTMNGISKWWDVMVAPVYGADGTVKRLVAVSRDITTLKELEKHRDEFIAMASHELKTPITVLKAYLYLLQEELEKLPIESGSEILDKMEAQVEKLIRLINAMLNAGTSEQRIQEVQEEYFDLNELAEMIVKEVQTKSNSHRIELNCTQQQMVSGDPKLIGQVIRDFLTNAIKYSPGAELIIVSTKTTSDENGVVLSVQDFGIGIAKEHHEKLFRRFYRVENPDYETYPGLGLGLYIAAGIIHQHDGEIWVESEEGKGSIFFFSLPFPGDW